jgi:hypothetical protein
LIPTVIQQASDPTRPLPGDRPAVADHAERSVYRKAAFYATRAYPGPVGELLSRELLAIDEFGYRIDHKSLGHRVATHILEQIPEPR